MTVRASRQTRSLGSRRKTGADCQVHRKGSKRSLASSLRSNQDNNGSRGHLVSRLRYWQTELREIVGSRQSRVHNSYPILGRTFLDLELQLLPICVDHHIDIVIIL